MVWRVIMILDRIFHGDKTSNCLVYCKRLTYITQQMDYKRNVRRFDLLFCETYCVFTSC